MKSEEYVLPILLVMTLALSSANALAGAEGKGGGVAFDCGKKAYLADSLPVRSLPLFYRFKKINENMDSALKQAVEIIRTENSAVANVLQQSLDEIHELPPVNSLPLLGNDKIKDSDVPKGCVKVQLGIQTFATGEVQVNGPVFAKLEKVDKLFFKLHEGYLRVLWHADSGNSPDVQAVRDQVFTWAKDPEFADFLSVTQNGACQVHVQQCYEDRQRRINVACDPMNMVQGGQIAMEICAQTQQTELFTPQPDECRVIAKACGLP